MNRDTTPAHSCTVERIDFHGWEAVELRNGIVHVIVVPEIGGHVMAYNVGPFAPL